MCMSHCVAGAGSQHLKGTLFDILGRGLPRAMFRFPADLLPRLVSVSLRASGLLIIVLAMMLGHRLVRSLLFCTISAGDYDYTPPVVTPT